MQCTRHKYPSFGASAMTRFSWERVCNTYHKTAIILPGFLKDKTSCVFFTVTTTHAANAVIAPQNLIFHLFNQEEDERRELTQDPCTLYIQQSSQHHYINRRTKQPSEHKICIIMPLLFNEAISSTVLYHS